jgi:GMP synthase-like glutamine amidotransferase
MRSVYVVQHTESEFLGLIEDHLEGRNIRFTYMRPFAAGGALPATIEFTDALFLLGGGPWSAAGERVVPGLDAELRLVWRCFERGTPVIGFGLGAQILALAAGGGVEPGPLRFHVGEARRVDDGALNGFLPERFPQAVYMAGRPLPPDDARILARDADDRPALFQIGAAHLGFTGHPGAKVGMIEDLAMEFDEAPADLAHGLDALRAVQRAIADALVPIMTGLVQVTGLMRPR